MKNLILLLSMICLIGCKKDDPVKSLNDDLVGNWKLMSVNGVEVLNDGCTSEVFQLRNQDTYNYVINSSCVETITPGTWSSTENTFTLSNVGSPIVYTVDQLDGGVLMTTHENNGSLFKSVLESN